MKRKKNIISKSETENESQIESSFYRLIFMGDSEVGKTQIINKYNNKIYQDEYFPTYSVDFQIKTIKNNGRILNIHCIDTEGSSDFSIDTGTVFIQKADAFIYVFDITSRDSLYNLKDYNDMIKSALTDSEKMINDKVSYVVGNKCDLVMYRQVQENEGKSEANKYKAKYIEVSAKTGINIDKLFDYIIQDIFKNEENSSSIDSGGGGILYKSIYKNNNQINNTNIINRKENQINTNINPNVSTNINTNIITNSNTNINTNIINNKNLQIKNNNENNNIVTNIINPTNINNNNENTNINNNINTNTNLLENEKSGLNYDNSSSYLKSNPNNNDNDNDLVKNINNIGLNNNKEEVNNPNFFSNNNNNNYFKKCQIF